MSNNKETGEQVDNPKAKYTSRRIIRPLKEIPSTSEKGPVTNGESILSNNLDIMDAMKRISHKAISRVFNLNERIREDPSIVNKDPKIDRRLSYLQKEEKTIMHEIDALSSARQENYDNITQSYATNPDSTSLEGYYNQIARNDKHKKELQQNLANCKLGIEILQLIRDYATLEKHDQQKMIDTLVQNHRTQLEALEQPKIDLPRDELLLTDTLKHFDTKCSIGGRHINCRQRVYCIDYSEKVLTENNSKRQKYHLLRSYIRRHIQNNFTLKDIEQIRKDHEGLLAAYQQTYRASWEEIRSLKEQRQTMRDHIELLNDLRAEIAKNAPAEVPQELVTLIESADDHVTALSKVIKGAHQSLQEVSTRLGISIHPYFLQEQMLEYKPEEDGRNVFKQISIFDDSNSRVDCGPSCTIMILGDKNQLYYNPEPESISYVAHTYEKAMHPILTALSNAIIFRKEKESAEQLSGLDDFKTRLSRYRSTMREDPTFIAELTTIYESRKVLQKLKHPIPYDACTLPIDSLLSKISDKDGTSIPSMVAISNNPNGRRRSKVRLLPIGHMTIIDSTSKIAHRTYFNVRDPLIGGYSIDRDDYLEKVPRKVHCLVPKVSVGTNEESDGKARLRIRKLLRTMTRAVPKLENTFQWS